MLATLRTGNRVLPDTARACGAPVRQEDLEPILNNLPLGKSPGPDRLPNKFYKTFSAVLSEILTGVFNEAKTNGKLPGSCTQGLISILYKKGPRDDPTNYRPITLLNGDYKILTRLLTQRMNEAVKQFVSPQQNGFVPGGFIAENTMLLKLIQAYVEDEDEEAFFLFLDMEKAFDRCSWDYLERALHEVGFEQNFIDYVKLFYSHANPPTRQININGRLGESFPLGSGVAQGCPCSPLLFLLITEALTRSIVRDKDIKGVEIDGVAHKISQYADDSTLIGRRSDWPRMQYHLRRWCAATAMKENGKKREGLLLGKLNRNRRNAPKGIMPRDEWQPDGETIRSLGVPFGNKMEDEILDNWWHTKVRQVKDRISAWKTLGPVSLDGRNMLVQAILYGSVRYWFFSLPTPSWVIEHLTTTAYNILWAIEPTVSAEDDTNKKKTRAHIAIAAAHLPRKSGGGNVAPALLSHRGCYGCLRKFYVVFALLALL